MKPEEIESVVVTLQQDGENIGVYQIIACSINDSYEKGDFIVDGTQFFEDENNKVVGVVESVAERLNVTEDIIEVEWM